MKHLIVQLFYTKHRDEESIKNFCLSNKKAQEIWKQLYSKEVKDLADLETVINSVLNSLTSASSSGSLDEMHLKELLFDTISVLEQVELGDLHEDFPEYTNVSIKEFSEHPATLRESLVTIMNQYIDKLEEDYKSRNFTEQLILNKYYKLKCKILDVFSWAGGYQVG